MFKNKLLLYFLIAFGYVVHAQTVGLFTRTAGSQDGYVLFAPTRSDSTYLIDKCGKRVHTWWSNHQPGLGVFLLPDGTLLRTEALINTTFNGNGSAGGMIAKYDWNSNLLWSYTISSATEIQNHDIYPMPNGNILVCIWENITSAQALAAGRNPALLGTSLWSAKIIEIQPVGTNSATIVWQWRLWDHLIQDFDNTKPNYGVVANHPELLNVNFNGTNTATAVDWIHLNAVTYNADLNQVMFSSHNLSEIYILDHSSTTTEASSHSGGTQGKGGDFIYRWGNPQSYNRGTTADRKLYLQHHPYWIPKGYLNENKIMIFNNGVGRPGGSAASVDIITPPVNANGSYTLGSGQAYGPATNYWSYQAVVPTSFFAMAMGGADELANGNIIICEAQKGNLFEIDSMKNTVWKYVIPTDIAGALVSQGTSPTQNAAFRCLFFPASYPGFAGKNLSPGNPIELNPLPYNCSMLSGLNEINSDVKDISIYPNPAKDYLNISTPVGNKPSYAATIVNVLAETVYQTNLQEKLNQINISVLKPGIYFIKITNQNNEIVSVRKFIHF